MLVWAAQSPLAHWHVPFQLKSWSEFHAQAAGPHQTSHLRFAEALLDSLVSLRLCTARLECAPGYSTTSVTDLQLQNLDSMAVPTGQCVALTPRGMLTHIVPPFCLASEPLLCRNADSYARRRPTGLTPAPHIVAQKQAMHGGAESQKTAMRLRLLPYGCFGWKIAPSEPLHFTSTG